MAGNRLWEKGEAVNQLVHRFTVGNDPEVDLHILAWDAVGSAAQAKMLERIGLLSKDECRALIRALRQVFELARQGSFTIPSELEDCHTAIEDFLVREAGDAGKKIHTGRSRNDQVLLAMRLYVRAEILAVLAQVKAAAALLLQKAEDYEDVPMPGYTHLQPAMPMTVAMWYHAFAEAFLEVLGDGLTALEAVNSNPLGAGAGFGVPLPLDRDFVTQTLGFSRTQRSPIAVQNSRGRFEMKFVRLCCDIGDAVEKLSWDLILYSTREFGFFSLPEAFTTGSSIMPQKHNPDVLELLRARASRLRACENELMLVMSKLPSNYHRDFQYTKEPVVRCSGQIQESLAVLLELLPGVQVDRKALEQAMTVDVYATYDAYREVRRGVAFRDAYRLTARRIKNGELRPEDLKAEFSLIADVSRAERAAARLDLERLEKDLAGWTRRIKAAEAAALVE